MGVNRVACYAATGSPVVLRERQIPRELVACWYKGCKTLNTQKKIDMFRHGLIALLGVFESSYTFDTDSAALSRTFSGNMMHRLASRVQQGKQRAVRELKQINTPLQRRGLGLARVLGAVFAALLAVAIGWTVFAVVVEIVLGQLGVP